MKIMRNVISSMFLATVTGGCALTDDTLNAYLTSKRIYITATNNFSASTGIAGADAACVSGATGRASKALIVDGTKRRACSTANCSGGNDGIDWVLAANTTYYDSSGTKKLFTTNLNGIYVFGLVSENLDPISREFFFTGLTPDWQTSANNCNGWSQTGSGSGTIGYPAGKGGDLISIGTQVCSAQNYVACVEQ